MSVYIFSVGLDGVTGLARATIALANAFAERNIDVSIVDVSVRNNQLGSLSACDASFPLHRSVGKYSIDNLSCQFIANNTVFFQVEQAFLHISYMERHKFAMQLFNTHLTENDLLIFNHPLPLALFAESNTSTKAQTIVQLHGNYIEDKANCELLQPYLNYVDVIQAISVEQKTELEQFAPFLDYREKIKVIYNVFEPLCDGVFTQAKTNTKIGIVGSVQRRKNQLDAIRLLEYITDKNISLYIYGKIADKNYYNELASYVDTHNLSNRVYWCDVNSEQEIYSTVDIVVMTSESEGFPCVLTEAAFYGVPCVTYDFKYGATEFSDNNKNGCLIKYGDVKSMAEKVKELLSSSEQYEAVALMNKKRLLTEYNTKNTIDNYLELFNNKNKKMPSLLPVVEYNPIKKITCSSKIIEQVVPYNNSVAKTDVFEIVLKVDNISEFKKFYYIYKKSIFNIENFDIIDEDSVISGKDRTMSIILHIPKKNQLTYGKEIVNTFSVCYEDKNQKKQTICFVQNGVIPGVDTYEKVNDIIDLKDSTNFMQPGNFFIRYPEFCPILYIENEKGKNLDYKTGIANHASKRQFYFSLKPLHGYKTIKLHMSSGSTYVYKMPNFTYKTIFQTLCLLETKYKFYELKVQNIYFYELIREQIFRELLYNFGIITSHFINDAKKDKIKNVYTGSKNIKTIPKNYNKLLFELPRKNSDVDVKSVVISESLSDCVVLEYPQTNGYSSQVITKGNHYPINDFLNWRNTHKPKIQFSSADNQVILFLKEKFKEYFGVYIKFDMYIELRLVKFLQEFQYFDTFFAEYKFKEVIITSSYWFAGIVAAAKKHGMIVSDIQYAEISKYHPTFSYPVPTRAYESDRIYLYSKYWRIPELTCNKSIVLGDNYFAKQIRDKKITKSKNNLYDVAFISQTTVAYQLFEFVDQFARDNPELQCIFLLHPNDVEGIHMSNLSNLTVSKGESLYYSSKSANVVGVYSTSLIEAVALGKNVYVLNTLGGNEVFEREIEKGFIRTISSAKDLAKEVKKKLTWQNQNLAPLLFNCEIPEDKDNLNV